VLENFGQDRDRLLGTAAALTHQDALGLLDDRPRWIALLICTARAVVVSSPT